jgi:glycosyltransferase involved in cell wall biosynthesis
VPCYNEVETLPLVVSSIPRDIPGVDVIEVLVIDDGSTDGTATLARALGVEHVVRHHGNRGLAAAFQTGLDACLRLGADIIVNTDGDNQYPQVEIPRLIQPILEGKADIVVADRQVHAIEHFSARKKLLQALGSWIVRRFSGTAVADAPSGFRAFSRDAAERLNVLSGYSHTLETLIQAGRNRMRIANVPVVTNEPLRKSRLFRNIPAYVLRSAATILRSYATYEPLRTFLLLSLAPFALATAIILRWLVYYLMGDGDRFVQSLIFAAALLVIGFLLCALGVLADLIAANRRLTEELLVRTRRLEWQRSADGEAEPDSKQTRLPAGNARR